MRRLWLVTYAAALLENDTRPLCRDVRIHDDPKKREGYGNQIHALVFAAEFARSCGLRGGRPSHIRDYRISASLYLVF